MLFFFFFWTHFTCVENIINSSLIPSTPPLSFFGMDDIYPLGPIPHLTMPIPTHFNNNVINFCAFQVYGIPNNTFQLQSFYNTQGLKFYEYVVNYLRVPPGVLINNTYYAINMTVINVGYDTNTTQPIVAIAVNRTGEYGHFDIFCAPWATTKALDCAPLTEKAGVPFIAPWAAVESAFLCPTVNYTETYPCEKGGSRRWKYMWGLISTGDVYWDSAINVLKLKGANTIGVWALTDSFSEAVIMGAESSSERNGITILTPLVILGEWNLVPVDIALLPSEEQLLDVFKHLQSLNPDIIICGNRLPATCPIIVDVMKQLNYQPQAIGVSQCITVDSILVDNDMRYFLDYSFWDQSQHGISYSDPYFFDWYSNNLSSEDLFNSTFTKVMGNEPNFYAAGTYAAGYAFELALQNAQSLDPEVLNTGFLTSLQTTFYGTLGFNGFGWNDKGSIIIIQRDVDNNLQIVYPSGTATADIVFPFVDFPDRVFTASYLGLVSEEIIFALFLLCVIYTAVCLALLLYNWKARSIQASSPVFLSIMLIGSALLYATVPTWMMFVDDASCYLRVWFLNIGFTLLFGTLTAKTHRIKTLFFLKKMRPKKFSDTKLLRYVAILVSVDIVLCILWCAITRPIAIKIVSNGLGKSNGEIWENVNFLDCYWGSGSAMNVFLALEGTYKTLMILYGLFLSTSLWKYGSSMWVESKQIIFSMYNLIVFALIGLALQLSLGNLTDRATLQVLFVTRSCCILLSGVITVATILLPRLVDPDGKGHEGKDTTGTKRTIDTAALQLSDLEFKYDRLEKKYKDLKVKYREAKPENSLSED